MCIHTFQHIYTAVLDKKSPQDPNVHRPRFHIVTQQCIYSRGVNSSFCGFETQCFPGIVDTTIVHQTISIAHSGGTTERWFLTKSVNCLPPETSLYRHNATVPWKQRQCWTCIIGHSRHLYPYTWAVREWNCQVDCLLLCFFLLPMFFPVCLFVWLCACLSSCMGSEIVGQIRWLSNLWFQRRSLTLSISLQPLFTPKVSSPQRYLLLRDAQTSSCTTSNNLRRRL